VICTQPSSQRCRVPVYSTRPCFRRPGKSRPCRSPIRRPHASVRVPPISRLVGVSTASRVYIVGPPQIYHRFVRYLHPLHPPSPFERKNLKQSAAAFMSSTGQATPSTDNVQLIIGALADYAQETGIDLSKNPFAAKLEQSNSPEAILQLLHEREKTFKVYRKDNRRLINCLNPAVKILHRFSGILGEAASQVSRTGHLVDHLT
jgi:fungal STAND N-terminal Goodbye domain